MEEIKKDTIEHIANLAKLNFEDAELDKFVPEFNEILGYISKIKECDVSDIEFEHNLSDYKETPLQEDTVRPSISRTAMLQNATEGRTKNGYIKTSKIVSKE